MTELEKAAKNVNFFARLCKIELLIMLSPVIFLSICLAVAFWYVTLPVLAIVIICKVRKGKDPKEESAQTTS